MVGIYLSGTGNTKHCIEKLLKEINRERKEKGKECKGQEYQEQEYKAVPIEDPMSRTYIENNTLIILAYPVQYSNAPIMVRDFIKKNADLWQGKKVFCMATMGAFSGDGAGCTARLLKKYGAEVVGGLHVKMPDSVCDSKLLKKTVEQNRQIVREADQKLEHAAKGIVSGEYPKEGLNTFSHIAGLFGQRLWFYGKTLHYSDKLKISDACVGCGLCAKTCPMGNISMKDGRAVAGTQCTMCYRCISHCPKQAITLLGTEVKEQCRFEKYE